MPSPDDFHYALENMRVVVPPRHRLATFGTSLLHYHLVTEEMDAVNVSRVREGRIQAERPQVITPAHMAKLLLEGFGSKAQDFAEHLGAHPERFAFLKYGFRVRKDENRSYQVHEPLDAVVDQVRADVERRDDPLAAVLTGVEDGWEVCLLKFMMDVIQESAPGNLKDLRDRGFME